MDNRTYRKRIRKMVSQIDDNGLLMRLYLIMRSVLSFKE